MEVKGTNIISCKWFRAACLCMLVLLYAQSAQAQQPPRSYTIKNGKMYITVGRGLQEASLDSFVEKYELQDLDLKQFIKTGSTDSLKKLGWKVDVENKDLYIISKTLSGSDDINDAARKIIFTQKEFALADVSPAGGRVFGYNRFRNKFSFKVDDSVVSFFLRANTKAREVLLAGNFTNWQNNALQMSKTDSGWIANVKLGAGKYLYKFIVDGNWIIDKDNLVKENDGMGNDNSVYYKANYRFSLSGYMNASRVYLSGSFNGWNEKELLMQRTATGWTIPVYLPEGTYTYRFIVDGNWMVDPANNDKLPNEFNDYNSVVRLGNSYPFILEGFIDAKKVVLLGSFNDWKDNELFMNKTAAGWELTYTLGPGSYEYKYKIDGREPEDPVNHGIIPLIIEPNYTFRLKEFTDAQVVCVAGDINNWNPSSFRMKREGDEWIFKAHLTPGKHTYKFVVDGKWILDPANKLWDQNEQGTGNSVIWITAP